VGFLIVLFLGEESTRYAKWCALVLALQIVVGIAGFTLHALADLRGSSPSFVQNVIHGAPPFAPLLIPNIALLGLLGLLALDRVTRRPGFTPV
jgi:hypothetical protein